MKYWEFQNGTRYLMVSLIGASYDMIFQNYKVGDTLLLKPDIIGTACPFCMTMMTDGLKYKNKEEEIKNYDIAELIVQSLDL